MATKKKNTSTKKTTPKKKTTAKQNVTPIPTKINIVEQTISNNSTKKKNKLKKVYTIINNLLHHKQYSISKILLTTFKVTNT